MEGDIIHRLKEKDEKTQEYFYKSNAKNMFLICFRYLNNEHEASEIMNDGFYKVFSKIKQFRNGGIKELKAWTRKIMVNECLQHIRKRKDIQFVETDQLKAEYTESMPDVHLEAESYYRMIRELPDSYRTVFNLYVIEGYSHKEITQMLAIPENTSRSHLLRARKALKEKFLKMGIYGTG